MLRATPFLAMAAVLLAAPADAQSLGQRSAQAAAEAKLAETLAATNAACGTAITARFHWETFQPEDYSPRLSLAGYCGHPLDAMRNLCEGPDGDLARGAVRTGIARFSCARGEERTMSLKDGHFAYTVNFTSSNDFFDARAFLNDNL